MQGHRDTIYTLTFSYDGRLLASAGGDADVMVWDIGTGRRLRCLRAHT